MTNKNIINQSPYIGIGFIRSIKGSSVFVDVDRDVPHNGILYEGRMIDFPRLYNYVLIPKGNINLIGRIVNIYGDPENISESVRLKNNLVRLPFPNRSLSLAIIGFIEYDTHKNPTGINYSISALPTVGDSVLLPKYADIECIVKNLKEHNPDSSPINLGDNLIFPEMPIEADLDKLISTHLGIVGNTGSGKSCTLVHLLRSILEQKENIQRSLDIILLDTHGEYKDCFNEFRDTTKIVINNYSEADDFPWGHFCLMDAEDLGELFTISSDNQPSALQDLISELKNRSPENIQLKALRKLISDKAKKNSETIGIGTEKIHHTTRDALLRCISSINMKLEDAAHPDQPFLKQIIENNARYNKLANNRSGDILKKEYIKQFMNLETVSYKNTNSETASSENTNLETASSEKKIYLHIIDLPSISSIYHEFFIGHILKNFLKRQKLNLINDRSVIFIADEAHLYVGAGESNLRELPYCQQQFAYLAKEGRKFGMHMVLATQKPGDINHQIFSQCNSFIIHRLVNFRDRQLISNILSDANQELLNFLPLLGQGEALFCGIAAKIPQYIKIKTLEENQLPKSTTPSIFSKPLE